MKTKSTPKKTRPKSAKDPSKMVPLRLPAPIVEELDAIANRSGNSRSSLIQLAIVDWLDERRKKAAE